MFTADDARRLQQEDLDSRIESLVKEQVKENKNYGFLIMSKDDVFKDSIVSELGRRGFKNISSRDGIAFFGW